MTMSEEGVTDMILAGPCRTGLEVPTPTEVVPDDLPGRWWVAHTKPRQEKTLARRLRDIDVFYYLPLASRVTRSKNTGRTSRSVVPVFPGYLFFNGIEQERHQVLKTNRIANLLVVPDQKELIRELRLIQKVLASGQEYRWQGTIQVGDWARVTAGPLAGMEGVVDECRSRLRLVLNVSMLGQSITLEVSRDMIVKLDDCGGSRGIDEGLSP